ncbi:IS21 family transposase [Alkalihalophilus marmarensis]|uniref:Transposase n=2 Tax=Alkalihalophilus TaxID=2893060 RepID=U6SIT2_9BACI|nr:IS21 family transposase [Alkalihalophilus marmarensis]ERN51287.1 transposase [Alkalihalophilus marmarensis DSM 21297]MCM3491581.1 IS21 family transposase [Alkalihalophilus marmarensis]
MLTMSDINCIKNLRNDKGFSITKIQKTLGINWRTAKKYGDESQLPQSKIKKKTGMMYENNWGEMVADWLFEDSRLKKKLRRTKKEIFKELQGHGFEGSYRTVCYFIAEWETSHNDTNDKGYDRLIHPPSEAQVDFGVMEAVKDGEFVDVHALVMSYPFSNTAFTVPLPSENQECFLEGLKILFKQSKGVPRKIRIDNLTPAVKKVRSKLEEAQLTDAFIQFQNHYGFEVQVCNPRSGHEKGSVENKVGYIRYNFFPTSPVMNSYEELTEDLYKKLEQDRQRLHYEKEVRIEDLWSEEKKHLLELPSEDYPVFKDVEPTVNKFNEVKLDNTLVHIPKASNYPTIHLNLTWDKFKAVSPEGEILYEDYRPYMHKKRAIPWLSIFKEWLKKPRVVTYSRYQKYLPGRVNDYLLVEDLIVRKERLAEIINLLVTHDIKRINEEFYDLISGNSENPFGIDWSLYDSLAPSEREGHHE